MIEQKYFLLLQYNELNCKIKIGIIWCKHWALWQLHLKPYIFQYCVPLKFIDFRHFLCKISFDTCHHHVIISCHHHKLRVVVQGFTYKLWFYSSYTILTCSKNYMYLLKSLPLFSTIQSLICIHYGGVVLSYQIYLPTAPKHAIIFLLQFARTKSYGLVSYSHAICNWFFNQKC